ncbi:hypothetical protein CSUI_010366 [Cystoisospora suis]|uniref:Uncharacterized protein n=1 Tax=Cystoisospora suis TaxID=483139 RepID=A0A2C6KHF6_9APIC|nr:hypothetical protein CSUI_010366 [Cystoisospora suis]
MSLYVSSFYLDTSTNLYEMTLVVDIHLPLDPPSLSENEGIRYSRDICIYLSIYIRICRIQSRDKSVLNEGTPAEEAKEEEKQRSHGNKEEVTRN